MGGTAGHPLRLREERESRGWTQEFTATQLNRLAQNVHGKVAGINADMISKWERGQKRPSKPYRELFALLYGTSSEQLGIGPATAAGRTGAGQPAVPVEDDSLVTALGGAAAVLDQLGPAGGILQPRMFDAWKDDVMQRRALLKLIGLSPALASLPALADPAAAATATPETVADLDELAGRYQQLYHSTPPAALITPVLAHLHTIGDLLRTGPAPALRRRLLVNRSRVGTLAGRLAFFDLQDPMSARAYHNLALEAAREAGDHLQAAAALGHVAFIPAAEHGYNAALDYLRGAAHQAAKEQHGPVTSWLAAVESEMHTNAGNHAAALAAVDRAREAIGQGLPRPLPWFDYYNPTRLAGFAGYATLRAGKLDDSRAALAGALEAMPSTEVKQRAVFLVDLATVELRGNDLEAACQLAGQAAAELARAGYATGAGRLREFRAAVEPWKTSIPVRVLDDQLAALR